MTGHQAWVCPTCERAFATSRALAAHKRAHWIPETCPQCGKEVKRLKPHLMKHFEVLGASVMVDVWIVERTARMRELEDLMLRDEERIGRF